MTDRRDDLILLAGDTARFISRELRRWENSRGDAAALALRTQQGLRVILLHAMVAAEADFANIQLVEPEGLKIAAQFGFGEPFLRFFGCVADTRSACGAALKERTRIVVEEVRSHPVFRGTAAAQVLSEANVQSVQSTPIVGRSGGVIGVLSTHYRQPRHFRARELAAIDEAAARAARWTEASFALRGKIS